MVSRPKVYGDERKCKAAIALYIRGCDDLIDQADGVRKRVANAGRFAELELIGSGWMDGVRRWETSAWRGLRKYLQEQTEALLPVLDAGPPKAEQKISLGQLRTETELDVVVPWLRTAKDELIALRDALGVRRSIASAVPEHHRFLELYASGLVQEAVIKDHEREMLAPRTPKQLADAIGSAKELTEATLRSALDRLGKPADSSDDLRQLMRSWRTSVEPLAPPDEYGQDALDKAQAALGNVVTFLSEWRNPYGRGHGRAAYPKGLAARHAHLAADVAETCIRFIVTTMDDLSLLPPIPDDRLPSG